MNRALFEYPPRRLIGIAGLSLVGLAFAAPGMRAAQPPAWVTPLLAAPAWPAKSDDPAVVLLEEATVRYLPEGKVRETIRQAVRVVSKEGEFLGPSPRAYNADTDRILKAQAWIVSADGRHTDSYGRNDFFDVIAQLDSNFWNSNRMITFTRTDKLETGGLVACELEIERQTGMNDTSWSFLPYRPVRRSVFEVTPLPGEQLISHASSALIPAPVPGQAPGSLRWEMRDLAKMPRHLPDGFIPNPKQVSVRSLGPASLANQMKNWGQFAGLAHRIVAPRMIAAPSVVAHAQTLVQGKTARWERIRALCEDVQKQIAYLSVTLDHDSLAGYRPHLPEEVLQNQLGDCKDKSTLLVTLLQAVGETAHPVLVYAGNPRAVMPEWPAQFFNHMVVGIPIGSEAVPALWPVVDGGALGKLVIFDPTDPAIPLGALPWSDQGGFGLVVADGAQELVTLPTEDPETCALTRRLSGELTERGALHATVDEVLVGSRAGRLHEARVKGGVEKFRQQLETRLHAALPLLSGLTWTEEWAPSEARVHLTYQFKADKAVRALGRDALLISPRLVGGDIHYEPWKTDWEGVVWLNALGLKEEIRLTLPEGLMLDSLPSDAHLEQPKIRAVLTYRIDGRILLFTRQVTRQACLLAKTDYDALYRFNQKLEEAERRPVIFRVAPAPSVAPSTP